ncbi:replication protein RepA [uncultured Treponema sp.]|uniref:replication protein RepA n=1 Tax=uncultured Treponema sp. TaxID=162155 RepID=UPI0025EF8340|nr:replication protein RepA [uncultured Treponema sp.]
MGRKKISDVTNETSLVPLDNTVEELFELDSTREKKKQIAYLPSFFTTASLPFKNMHKTVFVRKGSQGLTLTLTSPKNVPFGKYGRLLLSVLTTHAVISKNTEGPVLIEYASLSDLLKELQLPKQRGKDIREQIECFANASFSFDQRVEELQSAYLFKDLYADGDYPKKDVMVRTVTTGNIRFTTGVQYKEIESEVKETMVGRFKIILSDEFTAFCQKHAVPIDYEVYKEIGSPIGKDLYAWLVYRNNANFDQVFIPRNRLVEQFIPVEEGKNPNLVNVNYARIVELLKEIKEKYYKDVKFEINKDGSGITLFKSPTPVLKKDPRYALITADI